MRSGSVPRLLQRGQAMTSLSSNFDLSMHPAPADDVHLPAHKPGDRRLHVDEPVPMGLRRITLGQFDRAVQGLTDPSIDRDVGIHTARKTMKRLRGMLRMVRDEVGTHAYRQENAVLRDTSRKLAPAREKPYLFLGRLYKAANRERLAEKVLVRALQLDPDCVEALRELRLLNMRRERSRGLVRRILRR